jgi:hypothetical protein
LIRRYGEVEKLIRGLDEALSARKLTQRYGALELCRGNHDSVDL